MIATRGYIFKHRTPNGAWTKSQIEALGLDWPPITGWIDLVSGTELSAEQQKEFEAARLVGRNVKISDVAIQSMRTNDLKHLRKRLDKEIKLREEGR